MFYYHRGKIIFRVLVSVIYTIIDHLICLDYMYLIQDKLSKHDKNFVKKYFNYFSGIGVPEILMNLVSCHGFEKNQQSTVILT